MDLLLILKETFSSGHFVVVYNDTLSTCSMYYALNPFLKNPVYYAPQGLGLYRHLDALMPCFFKIFC